MSNNPPIHRRMESRAWLRGLIALVALFGILAQARAQISTVVFQDDFSAASIDPAKYKPESPFFEGGKGDIHAEAKTGAIEFVGTTTQQWWSGATLEVAQVFNASEAAPVTFSIDRVAEAGVGTASRSALWILDETRTKYVLFADVRAEGGWRYNRKIGENGDVPTGSGTDIAAFNGGTFDNSGLHRMGIVANGATVKLMLNGRVGAEVKFPFNKVVFQFGSYARANNDTAGTRWDNLKIEVAKPTAVVFEDDFSKNTIDPAKFAADAPFFEGGKGDIHAEAKDGAIEFVGTTTQQWWAGGTLRVVPTFNASPETPVLVSIDRVKEAGAGTASRSALWILDETQTKYLLFADVRAEGGWRYNRKIGENGDVPTGSGTDIAAFNGGTFDNGGAKKMSLLADGQTVKLMLDGVVGAEVKFPFNKVVIHFGSYARANNDTASTTFDNIKVETVLKQSNVVFQDDFASNAIDPARFAPDSPFFEGGKGDIHAEARNGTIEFVGTTTQQWWSGGTLRVVPTFEASDESVVTFSIDRVSEAGQGTASRSALWILDQTMTKYVLFADVRGEGGWRYNRKIGENGDVPTGGGNNMAGFDGAAFDDGGLHKMTMVADGKTVKLLLDGVQGAEVKFPFSPVVFQFGSYARANNDTAMTVWDNLKVEATGGAGFAPKSTLARVGGTSQSITVKIPSGLNASAPVQVRVVSSNPAVAVPDGGTDGSLTLTFPAGAPNTQTFRARGVALGSAEFSVQGGVESLTPLTVSVISGQGVQIEDAFGSALNTQTWTVRTNSFEAGTGTFTVSNSGGTLLITGTTESDAWAGASVRSTRSFIATPELNLVVEFDRVALETVGSAGRTGVYLSNADRSRFVFFAQNLGENGWQVNANPGNPTGGGSNLAGFDALDADPGKHRMKLVANGTTVEVFLDGVSGGTFPLELSSGIFVELAAYARITGDSVSGTFDNLRVDYVLPCIQSSPASVNITEADVSQKVTVTIPQLLNDNQAVTVTVKSSNPAVAVPEGSTGGTLQLTFAAGAPNTQSFAVIPTGLGSASFDLTTSSGNCIAGGTTVEVVSVPTVMLADDFSANTINASNWNIDPRPFDNGTATAESFVKAEGGVAKYSVTVDTTLWPGLALFTAKSYAAKATEPVTFEADRVLLDFDLVTGTGAQQRSGIWVTEPGGNFVFFSEHAAHDGRNFGWVYNKMTGQPNDNPTDDGVNITRFDGARFDDQKNHRMKVVANGTTVKLFLDDVFGAEIPFPFANGLSFGIGAYADEAGNVVRTSFDNVRVLGGAAPSVGRFTGISVQGANLVISWSGAGVLQSSDSLAPANWKDVTPAPTGKSVTIPASGAAQFYRLRQ